MKRILPTAAALLVLGIGSAVAQDKMTLQLKWVTQAQFAGYYVAKDKGFYKDVGLDVTIKPGGPDVNPSQVIAGGGADVIVDWMPSALATREKGVPLINIALGVWFAGNEYPFLAWMDKLGYKTSGGAEGVTVLKQGFNVDPLLQKQADCISTMTYNEYWQLIEAGMKPEQLIVFKYEDQGVATLEDGLYSTEKLTADAKSAEKLARLLKASLKGWDYAIKNQDEAVKIVLDNDASGAQTKDHQTRMMGEIAKLVEGGKLGYLEPVAYERTVGELLAGKSDPVISKKPVGAFTHAIWEAAQK